MRNASRPGLPGLVIGEKNMTVTALEGSYKLKYYDYNTFQIDEIMKDTFLSGRLDGYQGAGGCQDGAEKVWIY